MLHLVTGGSGYFGEVLSRQLLAAGHSVRVFDFNMPGFSHENLDYVAGDIRDPEAVARACDGAGIVYHNIAQVPLAKDRDLFWSVNHEGTKILLQAARQANIRKLVYTSSSAVYGAPETNPVTEETPPKPAEDYGRAKLAAEKLCLEAGLDVSILRPRTILGHGRLGVVQILFDWIARGRDIPVFDGGKNIYQFVHAGDLSAACIAAGQREGVAIYNIGAKQYGTMAETLEAVIRHAKTGSSLRSVPMMPAQFCMRLCESLGISPLGPYHALMYGRSLYFDTSRAERELNWQAHISNTQMVCESYDWYLQHREELADSRASRSHHQNPVRQSILAAVPVLLKFFPRVKFKDL